MKKTQFNSVVLRTFCLFLCVALLAFTIVRPVQVNAAAVAAAVTAGIAGSVAEVAIPVLVVILLLIACGVAFPSIREAIERAEFELKQNPQLKEWATQAAEKIQNGQRVIPFKKAARNFVETNSVPTPENNNGKVPIWAVLAIPTVLTALETLTRGDIITEDALAALALQSELLTELNENVSTLSSTMESQLSYLNSNIDQLNVDIVEWSAAINTTTAQFGRKIDEGFSNLNSTTSKWGRDTVAILTAVNESLGQWNRTNLTYLNEFSGYIQDLPGSIGQKLEVITPSIQEFSNNLGQKIDGLSTNIQEFPNNIGQKIDGLSTSISNASDLIVQKLPGVNPDPIPDIDVQVGTETITVNDYSSLGNAFSAKLGWIPQIFNFLKELFERITYTGEPPKVVLNLSSSDPSSPWNRDVRILDMSWYEPYKEYGDKVISGFMWLAFGWNLYKRTPDVLAGMGLSQLDNPSMDSGYSQIGKHERLKSSKRGAKGG